MKKLLIFLLLNNILVSGQIICKGTVLDSTSKQAVEFANVGIPGKGLGTVTNEKGEFSILIPDSLQGSKVQISMIGYKSRLMSLKQIESENKILLAQYSIGLNEVTVSSKKTKIKLVGNVTQTKKVSAGFNSTSLGTELAVKIRINHPQTHLRKIFINVVKNNFDKSVYRFNLYSLGKDGKPNENILKHNIIIESKEKLGLLEADLTPYSIYLDDDVFIAIEWIKDFSQGKGPSTMFSAKLIGSSTCFKMASQDKWDKIPSIGIGLYAEVAY